jgi:outer membrane protein assembly factor BamB
MSQAEREADQRDSGGVPVRAPDSVALRIWPAVVIVAAHLGVLFGTMSLASTNIQNLIGLAIAPVVTLALLLVWWRAWSRAPRRDRILGLVVFVAAGVWMGATHGANGPFLMVVGLPILTTTTVLVFALTFFLPWRSRRWVVTASIAACAAVFTVVRLETIGGDLIPKLSWRWQPSSEELLLGEMAAGDYVSGVAKLPDESAAAAWPGFRGPKRDGRLPGVTFDTNWDDRPPRELWRRRIGLGWSSFAVVGDYLFTQEQRGPDELVVCYRADTGEEVWVNSVETRFEDTMGDGPRATPTFEDGKLYALGATGVLQCLDASTGQTRWKRELLNDTPATIPTWGFASSPLVVNGSIVVFSGAGSGNSVVAYEAETGELQWSAGQGDHGYSSGHLADLAGVPQVLMVSNFGIQSFVPESGAVIWEHPWDLGSNAHVVQPSVLEPDAVLIGTSFRTGTHKLRVSNHESHWDIDEDWTTRRFQPYFNDFVVHKEYCYGYDGNRLVCISTATGERVWSGPRLGGQVLLLPDMDHLLAVSESGRAALVAATPDEYREAGGFQALNGKTWNHPVIANGRLFLRNSDEAAGFELSGYAD